MNLETCSLQNNNNMNLNLSNINRFRFCFNTARISFILGSILFLIQLIISDLSTITIIGLYYVAIALFVNLVILLGLILALIFESNKKDTLKSIGILSTNIPIAAVYTLIVINYVV